MSIDGLAYIIHKYGIDPAAHKRQPIEIDDTRHGGLTRLWAELGYTVGAEIGVEQGKFSAEMLIDNPHLVKLYSVDPWKAYDRYADHVSQPKLDRFYSEAVQRLQAWPASQIIRRSSMGALRYVPDGSLDFVYIDGNHHFDYVIMDILEWSKKVRPGGMVAGHDYRRDKGTIPFHVIEATQAYTAAHKIAPWFVMRRDKAPSFLWIKP